MKLTKLGEFLSCRELRIIDNEICVYLTDLPDAVGYAFSRGEGRVTQPVNDISLIIISESDYEPYVEWFEKVS